MISVLLRKKAKESEITEEIGECPSCGERIPLDSSECPSCGEIFALEDIEIRPAEVIEEKGGRKEKILFYLGVVLILVGGPGVALGSWLHDWFRIPFPGPEFDTYDAFGDYNRFVAVVGLIILIIGIVFLIFSLRSSKVVTEEDYEVGIERGEPQR